MTICLILKGEPPSHILLGWKKTGLGRGKYTGPGGKVEAGETPETAAIREVAEESGMVIEPGDLQYLGKLTFLFPARPAWDQLAHVFAARRWRGEPVETTEIRPTWFPLAQIPYAEMWDDYRFLLPRALEGQNVTARIIYSADNETVVVVDS